MKYTFSNGVMLDMSEVLLIDRDDDGYIHPKFRDGSGDMLFINEDDNLVAEELKAAAEFANRFSDNTTGHLMYSEANADRLNKGVAEVSRHREVSKANINWMSVTPEGAKLDTTMSILNYDENIEYEEGDVAYFPYEGIVREFSRFGEWVAVTSNI